MGDLKDAIKIMSLQETVRALERDFEMTHSARVERTGRSVAHLRD